MACIAMITGRPYGDIIQDFPSIVTGTAGNIHLWEDWLTDHGYAMAYKKRWQHWPVEGERSPWPPEPFADVHLCEVDISAQAPVSHMVVMVSDGTVLDPLTPERKRLADYHKVYNVAAIVKYRE